MMLSNRALDMSNSSLIQLLRSEEQRHADYKAHMEEYVQVLHQQIKKLSHKLSSPRQSPNQWLQEESQLFTANSNYEWEEIEELLTKAFEDSAEYRRGLELLESLDYRVDLMPGKSASTSIRWLQKALRYKDELILGLFGRLVHSADPEKEQDELDEQMTATSMLSVIDEKVSALCGMKQKYLNTIEALNLQITDLTAEITAKQILTNKAYLSYEEEVEEERECVNSSSTFSRNVITLQSPKPTDLHNLERLASKQINMLNILQSKVTNQVYTSNFSVVGLENLADLESYLHSYNSQFEAVASHVLERMDQLKSNPSHMVSVSHSTSDFVLDIVRNLEDLGGNRLAQQRAVAQCLQAVLSLIEESLHSESPLHQDIQRLKQLLDFSNQEGCRDGKNQLTKGSNCSEQSNLLGDFQQNLNSRQQLRERLKAKDSECNQLKKTQAQLLARLDSMESKSNNLTKVELGLGGCSQNSTMELPPRLLMQENCKNIGNIPSSTKHGKDLEAEVLRLQKQLKRQRDEFKKEKSLLGAQVKKATAKLGQLENIAARKLKCRA